MNDEISYQTKVQNISYLFLSIMLLFHSDTLKEVATSIALHIWLQQIVDTCTEDRLKYWHVSNSMNR